MKLLQCLLVPCLWLQQTTSTGSLCACIKSVVVVAWTHSGVMIDVLWPGECFEMVSKNGVMIQFTKKELKIVATMNSFELLTCPLTMSRTPILDCSQYISRQEWGAQNPKSRQSLATPLNYTVIHHSDTPPCYTRRSCTEKVKNIQTSHMNEKGLDDIAYNFLIGEDGNVYEGRGWDTVGDHTKGYNSDSIGICLIGYFTTNAPSPIALTVLHYMLICSKQKLGDHNGIQVVGHKDLHSTLCPGDQLYDVLQLSPFYKGKNYDNAVGQITPSPNKTDTVGHTTPQNIPSSNKTDTVGHTTPQNTPSPNKTDTVGHTSPQNIPSPKTTDTVGHTTPQNTPSPNKNNTVGHTTPSQNNNAGGHFARGHTDIILFSVLLAFRNFVQNLFY